MKYQSDELKDHWFKKLSDGSVVPPQCANQCQSYWSRVLRGCGLQAAQTRFTYQRIDYFWSEVCALSNENGIAKYLQLFALVKFVFFRNHGNASLKREFSDDKQLMSSHEHVMKEKAIVSLRLVKDELNRVSGVFKFPCTAPVIAAVKGACGKYFADVEQQRLAAEKEKKQEVLLQQAQAAQKRT